MVAVRVAGTGIGIPPELLSKPFRPLVTTKRQGIEVGLSICRTIIVSHGGWITAEPNPGGGTIFCFTLRSVAPDEIDDGR